MISDDEKLACIEREIAMRMRVYPRRVESGRMKQAKADAEIATMQSIADDYRARTDLFGGRDA